MYANIIKTLNMTLKVTQDHFYFIERLRDISYDLITFELRSYRQPLPKFGFINLFLPISCFNLNHNNNHTI